MDPKKDKFKGFKELKKIAAERFVKIFRNKLFIDIRKVRRFRIWQSEYLDHVMQGISQKNSEKQTNLKLKYLSFLNFTLHKLVRRFLYTWRHLAKSLKQSNLPNSKYLSSIKIASILILKRINSLGLNNFCLSRIRSSSWKFPKVKLALFNWKNWVISSLLAESHKEMASVKIIHFLHKKTTPLASFALRKFFFSAEKRLPIVSLFIVLKYSVLQRKHLAFMQISRKPTGFMPNTRVSLKLKTRSLQRFVALRKLILIVNKNKVLSEQVLNLVKNFLKWKSLRKPKRKQVKRSKGANRRIKLMGAKFLLAKCKNVLSGRLAKGFSVWRESKKKEKVFEIDRMVVFNQAQVAAFIEEQISKKDVEMRNVKKAMVLSNLQLCFAKKMKSLFCFWVDKVVRKEAHPGDRDIVYEYIRYLEENLGLPNRFRH